MNRNIYLITDKREKLLKIIKKYSKLKIGFIQYRDKFSDDENFIKIANKIYKITKKHKVMFIVNDRIHLLNKIKCDGFHVGQDDGNHKAIRKKYPYLHMGVSAHNEKEAKKALKIGANLLGVGSIFKTNTKLNAKRPLITDLIKIRKITNNIVVIGGINDNNIKKIPKNLYKYVASSSYLLDANNPKKALCKLQIGIKDL